MDDYQFLVNSSNIPKIFFKQLRQMYNLSVNDVLAKCNISKYVYDKLVTDNKISKTNVIKICMGLDLSLTISLRFFHICGHTINYYDKEDYIFLENYKKV